MIRSLFVLVLTLGSSIGVAATCEETQARMREKGVLVDLRLRAVDLFDTTHAFEKEIHLQLRPEVVDKPCQMLGRVYGFLLGRDVAIKTASNSYAGILDMESEFATRDIDGDTLKFADGLHVGAHHAIVAALLAELGFDTFEGESGATYQSLFAPGSRPLPSRQLAWDLLGVAGMQGTLYQITVKQVDVKFAD